MIRFPCRAFKENRVIFSREELEWRLEEAAECGKSCEVGFYAFSVWENSEPVVESVILDKIIFTGNRENLEKVAEKKFMEGYDCILIYDGARYLLFVNEPVESLEELRQMREEGVEVVTDVLGKFVFPGYRNLKTGQMSRILRKWKH